MNVSNDLNTRTSEEIMKTYNCMTCGCEMLRNTFICNICERTPREKNDKKHTETVREQYLQDASMKSSTDTEESAYWDYADRKQPRDDDGDIIEHDQANPDFVNKERIEYLEKIKEPSIDMYEAVALLKIGAEMLDEEERIAIQDFANGKDQRHTAKKLEVSQMTVSRKFNSGIKKLKTFYGDNYVA